MINKILTYALMAAFCAIAILSCALRGKTQENAVYRANQAALLDSVKIYKTESGRSAAQAQRLLLDYATLERKFTLAKETADELGIKLKRAQSYSSAATKTKIEVKTIVRDSIVYRDGKRDSVLAFHWSDPWVKVSGDIDKASISLNIESADTLVQIVHRVPKKFWFIKWGCKGIRQEVVSRNPHSKIVYTEYIELK